MPVAADDSKLSGYYPVSVAEGIHHGFKDATTSNNESTIRRDVCACAPTAGNMADDNNPCDEMPDTATTPKTAATAKSQSHNNINNIGVDKTDLTGKAYLRVDGPLAKSAWVRPTATVDGPLRSTPVTKCPEENAHVVVPCSSAVPVSQNPENKVDCDDRRSQHCKVTPNRHQVDVSVGHCSFADLNDDDADFLPHAPLCICLLYTSPSPRDQRGSG